MSLQVTASDTLNNTLTYSATNLPSGLSINSTSGLISGTIAVGADSSSPYAVTLTVTDSAGNSATQSFNWNVSHVLLVDPGPLQSLDNANVSLQLQGKDTDGDKVTYTASGLPSGLSINTSNGLISGTIASNADTSSPYNVTLTASDGTNTTTQTFLWTVTQVALALPSDQTNTEGDNVSLQLQGTASTGSLSYNVSGLPAGLSFNAMSGLISGTLAVGDAANGPYTVDVSANNGTVSASQSFNWTVNPVVNLTAPAAQSNNVGDSVSLQISATDSFQKTLNYSAAGLPSGLSINSSTGLISGKISGGDPSGGPFVVTVTAGDGTYSSNATFNWNVTDTATLTMTAPGTQDNVASDSVVDLQVSASDPDGDTLTYSATSLPDGLSIDPSTGLISGTIAEDAADSAPYQTTVTATDGNGQSVSQTFTWIVDAPPISVQASPLNFTEGVDPGPYTVATFTTPDMNSLSDDFAAIINYGDGTIDSGEISGGSGSFTVTGAHGYAEKGTYPVSIQIFDGLTGGYANTATTATVADGSLTLTGGFESGDPMTDAQGGFQLAVLSDANLVASSSDYSVTVNWGDGTIDTNSPMVHVTNIGNGLFLISGSHSYANSWPQSVGPVNYAVSISVTDADGASASTTSTVVVGNIVPGLQATMGGWAFVDQNTYATPGDFVYNGQTGVVEINWGDGTSSLGTLAGSGGNGAGPVTFSIYAWHTYSQDSLDQPGGVYPITVTATDDDGNTLTGTQYVSVVRPPMTQDTGNVLIDPNNLTVSNYQVAAFMAPDATDGTSEFTAQINWGDGTIGSGTIQEEAPGLFQVLGSHTYAVYDWYTITVTISQGWGGMAAADAGAGLAGDKPIIKILNPLDSFDKDSRTTLKVAKWPSAFYNNLGKDPFDLPAPRLYGDFNYRDPDRFFVMVKDPASKGNPIITIKTTGSPLGPDYNNPSVQVELEETAYEKGLYESYALLLVSDKDDNAEPIDGVANNAKNDLSYIVALGGTVEVTYNNSTVKAKVPIVKQLNLNVAVLKDPTKGGTPVISKEELAKDIKVANERYAQAGIVIKVVTEKIGVSDARVDLMNGYNMGRKPFGIVQTLSNEETALLGDAKLLPRKNVNDAINVYYVNKITAVGGANYHGWAYALNNLAQADKKYGNSVVIASLQPPRFVLPHELGHVLLNDRPGAITHSEIMTNLMFGYLEKQASGVLGAKRLTTEQVNQMYNNSASLLKKPSS